MRKRPAAVDAPDIPEAQRLGRDFRLYATGQAVSVIGDRVAIIALVFLVIHLSGASAPALALFYVCRVVPTLVAGLVAGVLVDHFSRKRLMIVCDLGRALLLVAIPTLSTLQLWVLYPMVLALYALTLLFDTAADAALPDVVPEERMTAANAVLNGIETSGDLAYAAGGALVFFLKLQTPFYIDAASFAFSALMISGMRLPAVRSDALPNIREVGRRIVEGLQFVMDHPFLRWSTLTFAVAPFAGGAVFVLVPLYANGVLGRAGGMIGPLGSGAFRFSLLEVSFGLGALAGSWLAARAAVHWPRGRLFGAGIAGLGAAYALLAVAMNIYVACVILALAGICNSLFLISGMTLVQMLTPSTMRGRVVAVRATVINGALALGSACGGGMLLILPDRTLWIVLGAIICASSLFVWLHPEVRQQI